MDVLGNEKMLEFYKQIVLDPNEDRVDSVLGLHKLAMVQSDQRASQFAVEISMADPGFRELWEEKFVPEKPDLQVLTTLPEDTFGYAFGHFMLSNKITLDPFYKITDIGDPSKYLAMRIHQTHDIRHVLTGYSTTPEGEAGVQGFQLAQMSTSISTVLLTAGLLRRLYMDPSGVRDWMDNAVEGYERGRKSKYVLGVAWERLWESKLEDLRREAQIPPPPT